MICLWNYGILIKLSHLMSFMGMLFAVSTFSSLPVMRDMIVMLTRNKMEKSIYSQRIAV